MSALPPKAVAKVADWASAKGHERTQAEAIGVVQANVI